MSEGGGQRGGAVGIILGVLVGTTLATLTGERHWLPVALTLGAAWSAIRSGRRGR